MHTGLSSPVTGFSCSKRKMVESAQVRSGRTPGRTIRRRTGPVRWSRRTTILKPFSTHHRFRPAGHRTAGEASGPAGLTAGASGPEAGVAGLIAEPALRTASNGQISTHLYIPLRLAGVRLELHQPLFVFEALTYPHCKNTKFHRSLLLANQSS
jgi:hypothetical protein